MLCSSCTFFFEKKEKKRSCKKIEEVKRKNLEQGGKAASYPHLGKLI